MPKPSQSAAEVVPSTGEAVPPTVKAEWLAHTSAISEETVEDHPSWSRDGRWIYFRSDRTGRSEIWKMAVDGGIGAVQMTRGGQSTRK